MDTENKEIKASEYIGYWTDRRCPKCNGAYLLENERGMEWCSCAACDFGLEGTFLYPDQEERE
jgi:hypothetical protein